MHASVGLITLIRTRTINTICIMYTSILVKHVLYSSLTSKQSVIMDHSSNKSDGLRANERAIMKDVYLFL